VDIKKIIIGIFLAVIVTLVVLGVVFADKKEKNPEKYRYETEEKYVNITGSSKVLKFKIVIESEKESDILRLKSREGKYTNDILSVLGSLTYKEVKKPNVTEILSEKLIEKLNEEGTIEVVNVDFTHFLVN